MTPVIAEHTVEVAFAAEADSGALNWGQQHILGAIRNLGSSMNMCALRELKPAAAVEDFADELRSDAALRYWENQLAALPPRRPTAAVPETGSRYRRATLRSVPLSLAATRIAHRLDCDLGAVLLGLFATALAHLTGDQPSAAQMPVSNRFRPGMADIVGNVSQTGLFTVDVADATVDEAIQRAQRSATRTYKYAYFDLDQWKALLKRIENERGEELALCYYNDRPSQHSGTAPGPNPSTQAIRQAAAAPIDPVEWSDLPYFNERLMVTIDNTPDGADAVTVLVSADTWHVPSADMERLARTMEDLAVAAACDPETRTGISAKPSAAVPR